ncbi:hypothetical protein KR100_02030 [Synechococcus sp. KORDI-100]|uniref:pentapeptide repeat-containing protein n=1 Tax=Synechococcus sp. KORDI-100 TaxID=1280380 RepID=UPI0004E0A673|nr:pentapeptide repeat-containing protein [Synechococcus sp. KORDI-100]AII42183.1 hypothetical protein KR100_02030 [Synechococcus sp. KORDI-100]
MYLNANGEEKGWGKKKVGGLVAKIKNKPELNACDFVGLRTHKSDIITGVGGETDTTDPLCALEPARWRPSNPQSYGSGASLYGADLHGRSLGYWNVQRSDLRFVDLENAKLNWALLLNADLEGAELNNAYLWMADLREANLDSANLEGANLQGANLQGAELTSANLRSANLQGAELQHADLTGALYLDQAVNADTADWEWTRCPDGTYNKGRKPCLGDQLIP